jgi:hypothetical protein
MLKSVLITNLQVVGYLIFLKANFLIQIITHPEPSDQQVIISAAGCGLKK